MLVATLLLTVSADPCAVRPLGWSCAAEKIRQLPEGERGMIYTILEGEAAKDITRLAVDTPVNRCWTAKVAGFEYAMLRMATLPDSGMNTYYGDVSMAYQARVEGKLDDNGLVLTLKALERASTPAPTEAAMQSALDGKLTDLIYKASNALIANAKTAASSFKPGCAI